MTNHEAVNEFLVTFANAVHEKFSSVLVGQPEDQLKPPVEELIRAVGTSLNHLINVVTEATIEQGRPDMAVAVDRALTGHIELKRPGAGADPSRFSGHDAQQWQKFQELPNLIYTDGREWALYRSGQRIDTLLNLGNIDGRGQRALDQDIIPRLLELLRNYFTWEPISPSSPRGLAEQLAPLCRFLRADVLQAVQKPDSALAQLADDWRSTLFPESTDEEFADAYAQTLAYSLLLAKFDGATDLQPNIAATTLSTNHRLLGHVLTLLTDPQTRDDIGTGVDVLVRVLNAVDPQKLMERNPDPWLYFYEDFLAVYDPKLREERGVYYTPVQVVRCQTKLVKELLVDRLRKPLAFADDGVIFLDPAAGTGTYALNVISEGIESVQNRFGPGAVPQRATVLAQNVHAFELLVGPYAVAHLRVTQKLQEAGATLPQDGVHIYLTDTLESPDVAPPGRLPLSLRPLVDEHLRAGRVKRETRVLVCMSNPPYSRQAFDASEGTDDPEARLERLLGDFMRLARGHTKFSHLASLYNSYVYFWKWALWKVFDTTEGAGIVSFITASSYLNGPGFLGMREVMRHVFDELWIIDLEGGSLGARRTENVFAIQTPVAIAIGVRYGRPNPDTPANVRYVKVTGSREDKLAYLDSVHSFADMDWQDCQTDWTTPFIPAEVSTFSTWPLLIDLFPWQTPGVKAGRTWPISTTFNEAQRRWQSLAASLPNERSRLFPDRRFGRKTTTDVSSTTPLPASRERISEITVRSPEPHMARYAYRSFVRHWLLVDPRLIDLPRPPLWLAHSERQLYITSLLTDTLGNGPAATVAANIPDLHHFHGRGGKDVIPLWRDAAGTEANITEGLLYFLANIYGEQVSPEDFAAYCYAILAGPDYTRRFNDDLTTSSPHIPITTDKDIFRQGVELGRKLIWLHTYGERLIPEGQRRGTVPNGRSRAEQPVPGTAEGYPNNFHWDEATQTLHVGQGTFAPISKAVWEFEVSGFNPLRSWLGYRKREPAGRKSSPLDEIRPVSWPAEFNEELLELLWILEYTVDLFPELNSFLNNVIESEIIPAENLPQPTEEQQTAPEVPRGSTAPTEQLSFNEVDT